jgi:hypothetical protein
MTSTFHIQYRAGAADPWQRLEEPSDTRGEPKPLSFKSRAKAEKRALEFSMANEGQFRVVSDQPLTGSYFVFLDGHKLVQTPGALLSYPDERSDVLSLETLIGPEVEALEKAKVPEPQIRALGRLLARYARCRPELLRKVHAAAVAAAEGDALC